MHIEINDQVFPSQKMLILGKIPFPIGGVRIHVQRLIQDLDKRGFDCYQFLDLDQNQHWKIFWKITKHKAVHLHTSNPWFQLIVSVFCFTLHKQLIITYHSSWGRYGRLKNTAESFSAFFATIPLVQNKESLIRAKKMNKNARIVSTFIPPFRLHPLPERELKEIEELRSRSKFIFCTNAWNVTFDRFGEEIYGISGLIKQMALNPSSGLIISDPSGHYQKYIQHCQLTVPENILWLSVPHDFWNILQLSDAFVRNTTTDGTSLSIQEALCCDCVVFASASVTRAPECHVYENIKEINLEESLEAILELQSSATNKPSLTRTVDELLLMYNQVTRCKHNPVNLSHV